MYTMYFDGSNKGDKFGCGACIIYKNQQKVFSKAVTLVDQPMSCNVAEYAGLILGLEWFIEENQTDKPITVFGDSNMVINQMFGRWKIKKGLYEEKAARAKSLKKQFNDIHGYWIPREENDEADRLSKKYPAGNIDRGDLKSKYSNHFKAYEAHQQRMKELL